MKSNKKKHIVVLTPGFPENEQDSVCIPALQIYLNALAKEIKPKNISIISFQYPYTKTAFKWNGISVYPLNGRNKGGFFKLFLWIKVIFIFRKIQKAKKISHIHSFWYSECAFVGSLISSFYKIQHICTFMGQDALSRNSYAKIIFKKPIIIALSDFHSQTISQYLNILTDKIIPWGIEQSEFPLESKERNIDILGVGSLIPVKNYSLFIDIISGLLKENKKLKSVIIGEGEEYNLLQDKIIKLDLADKVELKGGLQRGEVLKYMKQSKILLHTSNYESFGMVFIEALSSGCSIVSKPIGCYQEINEWKIGENKSQLEESLKELLKKKVAYKSDCFNINHTVKSYLKIYDSIN